MRENLDLVRDVLDKQIVDREETKMGRVDGVVLAIDDGKQPRVDHLELGFVVLARRLHPRLEQWLTRLRERWSVRRSARQVVPWSSVVELKPWHLQLDLAAMDTPAFDWERAMRKVVSKIPGSGDE
jgi:sporulation protein YlmC with PRC-barrel domain